MKDLIFDGIMGFCLLLMLGSLVPHLKMRYHKDGRETPWPFHQRFMDALRTAWVPLFMLAFLLVIVGAIVFFVGIFKADPKYLFEFFRSWWFLIGIIAFSGMIQQISKELQYAAEESETYEELIKRPRGNRAKIMD